MVSAWSEDEGKLPYLLEEESWSEQLEVLPTRPVPLLPSTLVATASRMMRGLVDYREGLRQAWQHVHQQTARPSPKASYQSETRDLRVFAEFHWVE